MNLIDTAARLHKRGEVASPKQARRPKGGEEVFPYYAGYSNEFVQSVLGSRIARDARIVLDPWNGSGTTTTEARRSGRSAVGIDLNPFAGVVAAARLANPDDAKHLDGVFAELLVASKQAEAEDSEPLNAWMAAPSAAVVRAVVRRVVGLLATPDGGQALDLATTAPSPLAAFVLLSVVRAVRGLVQLRSGSNPTWVRPNSESTLDPDALVRAARDASEAMRKSLVAPGKGEVRLLVGDARSIPLGDGSVDLVVSSPPYCTRLDYAVSTSLELAVLGISGTAHSALRCAMTGTPLIRARTMPEPDSNWGSSVVKLLTTIRNHSSADSASYYYKSYWQYFEDLSRSVASIRRVLAAGGGGLLVVQSSYYKDVSVDLPALMVAMLRQADLKARTVGAFRVPNNLVTLNTRAMSHRKSRDYRESIVAFSKA